MGKLRPYRAKRDFEATAEPAGAEEPEEEAQEPASKPATTRWWHTTSVAEVFGVAAVADDHSGQIDAFGLEDLLLLQAAP